MINHAVTYTRILKDKARQCGFDSCGVSRAGFLEEDARPLEAFLKKNYHGEMQYMANHFDKRLDPRLLVEGAKSVISLTYNYFPEETACATDSFKISKYAYGQDYHDIIRGILKQLVAELQEEIGDFSFRVFVDSAPVLERSWARKSGLGWIGKNANLLNKRSGSFFFLAEIICDLELVSDTPVAAHCGSCRRCIDACPTGAIVSDGVVDGSKCISYATIELKNEIPSHFQDKMDGWIFGCDSCQDVCPWNRFSKPNSQQAFRPNPMLKTMSRQDWTELTEELYAEIFRKSPVKRSKYAGLIRNIRFANSKMENDETTNPDHSL